MTFVIFDKWKPMFFIQQQAITHGRHGEEVWVPSEAERVASMIWLSAAYLGGPHHSGNGMTQPSPEKQDESNGDEEVLPFHSSEETGKTGGAKGMAHRQSFKGNIGKPERSEKMATQFERIAENKSKHPNQKHLNLIHYVNPENLKKVYQRLDRKKALGVDGVSKDQYGEQLEANLANLVQRMKTFSYRPQPARRVYIPKVGSDKLRPLGVPSLEDKLVQGVMAEVLNAIYEPLFYPCSYGFRPGKDCHQAINALDDMIFKQKVNYVVDADIKGFFDNIDHKTLMKFLEVEIEDKSFLRYIVRFLKSGIMEEGKLIESDKGTPQGSLISPILANVYLHYALDMWFEVKVKEYCQGFCGMVRYADDFVCCFEKEAEAKEFYAKLAERLQKFNLEIEVSKSKIIRFGRFAGADKGTFDFLGFTFISGKSRKGKYVTIRRTSNKKMGAKLKAVNQWLKENRHLPIPEMVKKLNQKLIGHYRYYGITGNYRKLMVFRRYVENRMKFWLGRRSQKAKMTWDKFNRIVEFYPLAEPKVYHLI